MKRIEKKMMMMIEPDAMVRQECMICGRSIRLLGDLPSLAAFLKTSTGKRRAFQCINCNGVICKQCRENGGMCSCSSNAWIARPYLGKPAVGSVAVVNYQ